VKGATAWEEKQRRGREERMKRMKGGAAEAAADGGVVLLAEVGEAVEGGARPHEAAGLAGPEAEGEEAVTPLCVGPSAPAGRLGREW